MATNWNAILSNANSLTDILLILRKVLAGLDGKADLTLIDEALADILKMKGDIAGEIEYFNKVINESVESGLYVPFSTQAELLAYVPDAEPVVGKAFDTFKVWIWETRAPDVAPKWHDTGLSELDQANKYANTINPEIESPSLYYFYDKSGNIVGSILANATFELDNFKTPQLRETLLNVVNSFFTSNSASPFLVSDKMGNVILEIENDGIADSIDPSLMYSLEDVYAGNITQSVQARFLEVSDLRKSKNVAAYSFNSELAPYNIDGTLHQRMACAIKLKEGKLILFFSQFSAAGSDAQDGRLVYRFVDYNLKNKTASASQTFALHGNKTGSLSRHPNVIKHKHKFQDRITCVFNSNNDLLLMRSDDSGVTWSAAQDISPLNFPKYLGLGALVEMQDEDFKGRLVLATYDTANNIGSMISKDGGVTWKNGGTYSFGTTVANEVAVTEDTDGSLIYVVRTESDNPNILRYLISKDGGETLEPYAISEKVQTSICQIDILQVANQSKKCIPKILVCHPQNGGWTRQKFRILTSYDKCKSYRYSYAPYVDSLNVGYATLLHLGGDDYVCINEQGALNQQQSVHGFFFNSAEIIKNG